MCLFSTYLSCRRSFSHHFEIQQFLIKNKIKCGLHYSRLSSKIKFSAHFHYMAYICFMSKELCKAKPSQTLKYTITSTQCNPDACMNPIQQARYVQLSDVSSTSSQFL